MSEAVAEDKGSAFKVQGEASLAKGKGYTVLVIDDEEMIRTSWEFMTTKLGIEKLYSYASLEELQTSGIDLSQVGLR